jgi:hypothetical protein
MYYVASLQLITRRFRNYGAVSVTAARGVRRRIERQTAMARRLFRQVALLVYGR